MTSKNPRDCHLHAIESERQGAVSGGARSAGRFCEGHDLIAFCDGFMNTSSSTANSTSRCKTAEHALALRDADWAFEDVFDHGLADWLPDDDAGSREPHRDCPRSFVRLCADAAAIRWARRACRNAAQLLRRAVGDVSEKARHFVSGACRRGTAPFWPTGAYYVLADVRKLGCQTARGGITKLLDEVGIPAAISGSSFYQDPVGETMLRFCFAKPDDVLEEAAARLRRRL